MKIFVMLTMAFLITTTPASAQDRVTADDVDTSLEKQEHPREAMQIIGFRHLDDVLGTDVSPNEIISCATGCTASQVASVCHGIDNNNQPYSYNCWAHYCTCNKSMKFVGFSNRAD